MNDALRDAKNASLAAVRDVVRSIESNVTSDAARYNERLAAAHAARADAVMDAYEASKRTDLGFVEKANRARLEKLMGSMFLDAPGGPDPSPQDVQTLTLDGETIVVDATDPWRPSYDRGGRLERRPDLGAVKGDAKEPRTLVVEILAARDLEATDLLGTSDPYAVVTLGAQRRKTSVKRRTLRPVWAERFADVVAAKELEDDEVDVSLYDHDAVGSHDFLGRIGIPVTSIEEGNGARAHWVRLAHAKPPPEPFLGSLVLAAYHDADVSGRLHVYVVGARDVPAADVGGGADPYVRVSLLRAEGDADDGGGGGGGRGKKNAKKNKKKDDSRRTRVRAKTREPVWAEAFAFEHVDDRVDDARNTSALLLELYDKDLVGSDDALAQLVLPLASLPKAREGDRGASPVEHEWRVHSKNRRVAGELNLMCFWEDRRKTKLCVRVMRARNVKAADVGGTSDPYVVGTLRAGTGTVKGVKSGDGREDQTYRTKTVRATLNPEWNHNFHFRVYPSTRAQVRDSQRSRRGFLGAIVNAVVGDPAVRAARRAEAKEKARKAKADKAADAERKKRLGVRTGLFARAFHGDDGFRTDVKERALARERTMDHERMMVSTLGGAPHGRGFNEEEEEEESDGAGEGANSSGVNDVRGQVLELDLYDADDDEGIFSRKKDDFLGRILVPLERVATVAEGGDKKSLWMPWREKRDGPVKGEVCVRCYFPSSDPVNPGAVPDDLAARLREKSEAREALKLQRVRDQAWALYQELEGQLRMQLLCQKWPAEIAAKYARAYARHGHEHRLIPPPPDGCTVPASFHHMFETAEKAARAFNPPAAPEFPMAGAKGVAGAHRPGPPSAAEELEYPAPPSAPPLAPPSAPTSAPPAPDPAERARIHPPVPTYSAAQKEVEQAEYERTLEDFPELADAEHVARERAEYEKTRLRGAARRGWAVARRVMDEKRRELARKDALADDLLGMVAMARENETMAAEIARIKAQMAVFESLRNTDRGAHEGPGRLTSTVVAPYRRQGYERRAALARERREESSRAAEIKKAKDSRRSDRELERTRRRAPWSCAADAGPAARYMSAGGAAGGADGGAVDPNLPAGAAKLAEKLAGSTWSGFYRRRERAIVEAVEGSNPARGVGASAATHAKARADLLDRGAAGGEPTHVFHGPPPPPRPAAAVAGALFKPPPPRGAGFEPPTSASPSEAPTWEREEDDARAGGHPEDEPPPLPPEREAQIARLPDDAGVKEPSLSKYGPRHSARGRKVGTLPVPVPARDGPRARAPLVPALDLNVIDGSRRGGTSPDDGGDAGSDRETSPASPGKTEKLNRTRIPIADVDDDDEGFDDDGPVPRLDLRGLTKTPGGASGVPSTSPPKPKPKRGDQNQIQNQNAARPSRLSRTTTVRARIAADWDTDDVDA